jgi:hypothetical protein
MKNIRMLKRMEHSTVKPTDLWTAEDDVLFLKYCPNKRDKAYHTIARDSSCRPSEILNLRLCKVKITNYCYDCCVAQLITANKFS